MLVFSVEVVDVLCIDIKTHNFSTNLKEGSGAAYILITCQQLKEQNQLHLDMCVEYQAAARWCLGQHQTCRQRKRLSLAL